MLSISSLAIAARWPPQSLASISTSLAIRSSFFTISPCTLLCSVLPSTSPSSPLLTAIAMRLQARATTSMSRRSCAEMWPCSRCCSTRYWVRLMRRFISVLHRARDDLAHVVAQVGSGGHARDGLACGAAVRLCESAPAVHHARQARGQLRVHRVELEQPVGPEHVARGVAAVEGTGVVHAQRVDQAARAVGVGQREVRMLEQRLGAREDLAVVLGRQRLQREPLVDDERLVV